MALAKLPMKAPSEIMPFDTLRYPQYASTKFDGFRLLALCGERFLSPALKPFPNRNMFTRWSEFWSKITEERLVIDGEVWSPDLTFQELQSIIRSNDKPIPHDIKYYVFDVLTEEEWDMETEPDYHDRHSRVLRCNFPGVVPVQQSLIRDPVEAIRHFTAAIAANQEGIILRNPNFHYKHGRCTKGENGMWKFKQFTTHDAVILDVVQRRKMRDDVQRETNAVGLLERVHTQDAYDLDDAVGSFLVSWNGTQFNVTPGRGFSLDDRRNWWTEILTAKEQGKPNPFIGRMIEFKFMPHGTMDKPRIGSLVRFRDDKLTISDVLQPCPNCCQVHHTPIKLCECECCRAFYQEP